MIEEIKKVRIPSKYLEGIKKWGWVRLGVWDLALEQRGEKYFLLHVITWDCYGPTSYIEEEVEVEFM